MIRRTWKRGDYLVIDDESGKTILASEARQLWDGSLRHYKSYETRHPQEFVKARNDPKMLTDISPIDIIESPSNIVPLTIGETNVVTQTDGAAAHLFDVGILPGDPGIGEMILGAGATDGPFFVRYR